MIYYFDKNELTYKNVTTKMVSLFVLCCVSITLVVSCIGIYLLSDVRYITEEIRLSILKEKNEFSPDKLKTALVDLNVKFPHIVYAQARLETGNFTSKIFKENNNLFGMREATVRASTNKGTENDHAYFNDWYDSVIDYALYQANYLSDIKNEDEYLQYLKQNYAEAPNYMEALLVLLSEENF